MNNVKVAIIDSGISPQSICCKNVESFYKVRKKGDSYVLSEEPCEDLLGHGTAIAEIIYNINPQVQFLVISIYEEEQIIEEEALIKSLEFLLLSQKQIDIINISAGIIYIYHYKELEFLCNQLKNKGILLVSAFDNDGPITYPAALGSVIGVDVDNQYTNRTEITLIENAIVNIMLPNKFYRINWKGRRTLLRGTSFATAYVTGLISKENGAVIENEDTESIFHKICHNIVKNNNYSELDSSLKMPIKKAIIFPLNKESEVLLRFKNHLAFTITDVYDEKVTGNVGKEIMGFKIKSFDKIEWDGSFDTIILSCFMDLSKLTKRNYEKIITQNAQKYNKQIYSFEDIGVIKPNYFYPKIDKTMIPKYNLNKLHKISKPIIGVFGTSPKQGKYTLQLKLINYFKLNGYKTGFLSSEPSGYLLGADYVAHFGYHSFIDISPSEFASILNEMMWEISKKDVDIIITGCQSNSIHYELTQTNDFALYQYAFALGTLPDFLVLCINPHDDINYILRTIQFLNSIDEGKVYAIVLFPVKAIESTSGIPYKMDKISANETKKIIDTLKEKFEVPIFSLDSEFDISVLCNTIINYFSEDNI